MNDAPSLLCMYTCSQECVCVEGGGGAKGEVDNKKGAGQLIRTSL